MWFKLRSFELFVGKRADGNRIQTRSRVAAHGNNSNITTQANKRTRSRKVNKPAKPSKSNEIDEQLTEKTRKRTRSQRDRNQKSVETLTLLTRQPINSRSTSISSESQETDDGIGSLAGSTSGKHDSKINE